MANPNKYSGQPTYSRDVTALMRRINALEARVSVDTYVFHAYDFDISDGRVYVLARAMSTDQDLGYRIYTHDAATGAPVQDFAIPLESQYSPVAPVSEYYDTFNLNTQQARPRICVGNGRIFMAGTRTVAYAENTFTPRKSVAGRIYSFDTNGSDLKQNTNYWPRTAMNGQYYTNVMPASVFGAEVAEQTFDGEDPDTRGHSQFSIPDVAQLHYVNGYIWGMVENGYPPNSLGHFNLAASSPGFLLGSLCYASEDFSDLGWIIHSTQQWNSGDFNVGIGGYRSRGAMAIDRDAGLFYFNASRGSDDPAMSTTAPYFGSKEIDPAASGEADLVHSGFGFESLPSYYATGTRTCPHALQATDGTYLFAWYDAFWKDNTSVYGRGTKLGLLRYYLTTPSPIDSWGAADGIGEVIQMRVYDGVLWLLMKMGVDEGGRFKVESRDPATMAVLSKIGRAHV